MARNNNFPIEEDKLYDEKIRTVLRQFSERELIESFEITERNSKLDKLGIDGIIHFRINGKYGALCLQIKSREGAIFLHRKKYPAIPVILVRRGSSLEEVEECFMEFLAFWKAYNFNKEDVFKVFKERATRKYTQLGII